MSGELEKFIFVALSEADGGIERKIYLHYHPHDNSVEIIDEKSRKPFLRRTKVDKFSKRDFFVGSRLLIFGRNITIVDYGDSRTRQELSPRMERTFLLLKSQCLPKIGEIWAALIQSGFQVVNCLMIKLRPEDAVKIHGEETDTTRLSQLITSAIEGSSVALEIISKGAVAMIKNFFEEDHPDLSVYFSSDSSSAARDIEYFFKMKKFPPTASFTSSTLAIVKPHAVRDGKTGEIIKEVLVNGMRITAMRMVHLNKENCENFFKVYKGVAPEFNQMCLEVASGPCLVMEISAASGKEDFEDSYGSLRRICGPYDPDVARRIRPQTLRAKFGSDRALNAIHCTDLEGDCASEVEFFFGQ
ncbi:Nucleoside diphosphate kinase [Sergentomyia squamirostris]